MSRDTLPPALVLAAGLGTRLRPLTHIRAKPAMPVAGPTLLERILRWLAAAGIRDIVVNLHHRPETIAGIAGDGSAFGVRVRYSWEPVLLGSGGGPARALGLVDASELLVVNGDTLTDVDPAELVTAHRSTGALVTMALVPQPDPARYGSVRLDDAGNVVGFTRRGERGDWHFVGVQVVARDAFAGVSPDEPSESVLGRYRVLMAERGLVRGWTTCGSFRDIGTPEDYLETCEALATDPRQLLGHGSSVAGSARIERTVLWDGVVVASAAELEGCIVADGVVVPSGSRYHRQIVLRADQAPRGPGDRVEGALLLSPLRERP